LAALTEAIDRVIRLPAGAPDAAAREIDLTEERNKRADAGQAETFDEDDLYPDARSTLATLRADGLWVGIAGNQTKRAGDLLRSLDLPLDMIATSDDWGVSKPDPEFFRRLVESIPHDVNEILYVGDRLDNDIDPAASMGLQTALIRRGPWAFIQQTEDGGSNPSPPTRSLRSRRGSRALGPRGNRGRIDQGRERWPSC
jgi:HAD superfamily hydrolase (TIGR01662 family)